MCVCVWTVSLLYKNTKIKVCRTIILPVVLYECETWSFTLMEEGRLKVELNVFHPEVLSKVILGYYM